MFLERYLKHGEKLRMWLKELKIAIIEKNTAKIDELINDIPTLEKNDEIQEAIYLLKAASDLVSGLQNNTQTSMSQMKRNLNFLKSTESKATAKFDVKS